MHPPRFAACATLATALLSAPGCSLALKTDEAQCVNDADCAARGKDFAGLICAEGTCQPKPDPKWGCLGEPEGPPVQEMVEVKVQFLDLITENGVSGADLKLCKSFDPLCNTPIATKTSDAQGFASITLESDFQGFVEVDATGYLPEIIVMDAYAAAKNGDILLIPEGAAVALSQQAGVPIDPMKGIIIGRTADCQLDRTEGVSVSLSPSTGETRFYVINNLITKSADRTDKSGNSGFVNVDPGSPEIRATLGPDGEEITRIATLVRAGTVTGQVIRPAQAK
jgi:hypothetical protein